MASLQLALASLLLACAPAVHANTVAVGPAAAPVAAPVPDTIVAPIEAPVADTFVAPVEVAAATPVAAPAAAPVAPVSAVPAPPIRSGGSPEWPKCDFFSGNESHTILGIMAGEWTRKFGPANFDLILEKVDAPTKAILTEFDLGKPGHTLMVPLNEGKNFTDRKLRDVNTFLQFGVVPQLLTTEEATFIVRNHLINETITYSELQSITELGNTATYKSLGHTVWEFTNQGGGIKLVDRYDIGQGRTKGVLFIQADITNAKQGECPNAVFSVDGFIATPENVPLPPPPPAPVAPVQAPTATVRAPPANFTNPFAAPTPPAAPLTATPPAEEAAVVDQSASAPPHITAGALVALGAIFTTVAFLIA